MDNHRNIQIRSAPAQDVMKTAEALLGTPLTLHQLLSQHPQIQRISMFPCEEKMNLAVSVADYFNVCEWLDKNLERFTKYHPKRSFGPSKPSESYFGDPSVDSPGPKTSKFSARFKVATTAIYDPTSAPSKPRRNAWAKGPPVTLVFSSADMQDDDSEDDFRPFQFQVIARMEARVRLPTRPPITRLIPKPSSN